MTRMTADELRRSYLDFFRAKEHALVPSASLVPENDPTLLFTGAGMNQFKDLFLGRGEKPYSRATSCQKCFRTGDLEEVGRTNYHHTFFEMLGNFSFGDYFKREAITWGWEFLTEVMGLDPAKLWVSVYREDEEAYSAWRDEVGIPEERIRRFGAKTNFWPANAPEDGPNGVCGPCSEIFFDYGPDHGPDPDPDCDDYDGPRFTEIWNLVFTQFNRTGKNELEPLPQKNIDTGAGFERLVAVMNGHLSTYGTDLFLPIIAKAAEIAGIPYEFESPDGVRMRRIADHGRAAVFCLLDGVKPGREGRDFVLRRVIRRAVRDGIGLGIERPFLADTAPVVADVMGDAYPEIREHLDEIRRAITREEERFRATYHQGMNALVAVVDAMKERGVTVLAGEEAFRLHDERGFPVDLTEDYLREEGLSLDRAGFTEAMEARRKQSQAGSAIEVDIFARGPLAEIRGDAGETEFTGYGSIEHRGTLVGLVVSERRADVANTGDAVQIVADRTPFYAESGGQMGDAGEVTGPTGRAIVGDTKASEGVTAMIGEVVEGTLAVGDEVTLALDVDRRDAIRRNHTATHLLHRALKNHLGEGATQAGSLVAPDRLRFDFHHEDGLSGEQVEAIEREVNREIVANTAVHTDEKSLSDARNAGAVAIFGEKYGENVRVVSVGGYSMELCGGTHCRATGEIGSLRIVSESNIGAGLRRIEAVTGVGSIEAMVRDRNLLQTLARELKSRPEDLPARIGSLREDVRELRKKLDQALAQSASAGPDAREETLPNGVVVRQLIFVGPYDMKHLLAAADGIREEGGRIGALLTAETDEGIAVVVAATPDLTSAGFDAGKAVGLVAREMGGGGGGRPDLGRGKGRDPKGLPAAEERFRELLLEVAG